MTRGSSTPTPPGPKAALTKDPSTRASPASTLASSRRIRLRTILMAVNVAILLLPLVLIGVLRLYQDELIRQTESALIAQGAFVAAAFREVLLREALEQWGSPDTPQGRLEDYGHLADPAFRELGQLTEPWAPIEARLRLGRSSLRKEASEGVPATPEPLAKAAGARITPLLTVARRNTLAGIRVVDSRGVVVATTGTELGLSLFGREEVARGLRGEPVSLLRRRLSDSPAPPLTSISRQSDHRVFVAIPVLEGPRVLGAVVLSRSPMSVATALYRVRYPAFTALAALVAIALLVALLTSLTIDRPLRTLMERLERVGRGEARVVAPLEHPGTLEVEQLSDAFVRMTHTLEERADYIRTFASAVSHEFKTPLTSLRGTIELLHDHFDAMSPDERQTFLSNLESDIHRLDRLVSRLLELARADVLSPGDGATTDVAEALEAVSRRMRDLGMNVTLSHGQRPILVRMARETLETLLFNLVDNARQHGGEGVEACLESRLCGSRLLLTVQDTGKGISQGNAEKVFTPFFTTARAKGGTGLGLAIVRSLLQAHGGRIELAPSEQGARFVIDMPASAAPLARPLH